jgi:hypothetical protein
MPKLTEDLTNKKFGRLIALKPVNKQNGFIYWLCCCDCGTQKIIAGHNLQSSRTQSCGCLHRERVSKAKSSPPGVAGRNALLRNYKHNAEQRDLIFELPDEAFLRLTRSDCFYCGAEPAQIMQNGSKQGAYTYNGVDRVDNSKGYVEGNCVSCCGECNTKKGSVTVAIAQKMVKFTK